MDLTAFTAEQLYAMSRAAYKTGIQHYDDADQLIDQMRAMPSHLTPGYRELRERYRVVRAAADEQADLHMAISAELDRRAACDA